MCKHLKPLESYLQEKNIPQTFRGQAWSLNPGEWTYFDCFLDTEELKTKLSLPAFIMTYENTDLKSGTELGLVCKECNDAIVGLHPAYSSSNAPHIK